MTLEKAHQRPGVLADFRGFYNPGSAKPILSEVMRERGRAAVDALILHLEVKRIFRFRPGTRFTGGWAP